MKKATKLVLGSLVGVPLALAVGQCVYSLLKVKDYDFDDFEDFDEDYDFSDPDIEDDWDSADSLKESTVQPANLDNPFDNKFVKETLGYEVGSKFDLKEKSGLSRDEVIMEILSASSLYSEEYLSTISDLAIWIVLYQLRQLIAQK